MEVPEDPGHPGGRTITLHYVVMGALDPTAAPLFMFNGGPGSGSSSLAPLANIVYGGVRKTRDVVLIDQRGTGESSPLACATEPLTPGKAFGHIFNPDQIRDCHRRLSDRADLSRYTTADAVADIDLVRRHLGYERMVLWGGSYGTRLAQAYARAHPERVEAMVLDGVVPFDIDAPATYARTLDESLERVATDCAAAAACAGDTPTFRADLDRVLQRFDGGGSVPVSIRLADGEVVNASMHRGDFAYAIRGILYSAISARQLPHLIRDAARSGSLDSIAQRYWDRAVGLAAGVADGLHLSVFCAEDVPFIEDRAVDSLTAGTLAGRYLIDEYRGACARWERAPIDRAAFTQPLAAPIPTLLVSGWFDPVTPPWVAEQVARSLPLHRHLVVRNSSHGSGFQCARPAVLHVLLHATLEGIPEVCGGVTSLWP